MALQKIKIWLNDSYLDDNRVFCLAENPELGLITLSKKQKPNDPDELSLGSVFTKNHFTTI